MAKIITLEHQIAEAQSKRAVAEQSVLENPNDFASSLAIQSVDSWLSQLQSELREELNLRDKEVVELHLSGEQVESGSIPLWLLGEIAKEMASALTDAAKRIKGKKRIKGGLDKSLDLRLSGIASGSTRLLITGNVNADLWGNSLLSDALSGTFSLLQSQNAEELTSSVSKIGVASSRALSKLLKSLSDKEIDTEISWHSPNDTLLQWKDENDSSHKLADALESIEEMPSEILIISGTISSLSLHAPIEIKSGEESYLFEVSDAQVEALERNKHYLGQLVKVESEKQVVTNRVTGLNKTSYFLQTITGI